MTLKDLQSRYERIVEEHPIIQNTLQNVCVKSADRSCMIRLNRTKLCIYTKYKVPESDKNVQECIENYASILVALDLTMYL